MLINILIFLIVLGVLVFFHELGHFVAAKACGVYVDRFSLGMPPRVWGFRWGETDYCIGALPIGGYVKMAGQEDAPRSEETQQADYADVPPERWFNNKTKLERFIILVAGPLMNLVLAVVLYGIVAGVGAEVPEVKVDSRIGKVQEDSPALHAPLYPVAEDGSYSFEGEPAATGWRTGDRILEVNGKPVRNIVPGVAVTALLSGGKPVEVLLERPVLDGEPVQYISRVTPKVFEGERMPRYGISAYMTAQVGAVTEGMPAAQAGLEPGDIIVMVDGEWVDWTTLTERIAQSPPGEPMQLFVQRGNTFEQIEVTAARVGGLPKMMFAPAADDEEPAEARASILEIDQEFAEITGLQRQDIILSVNETPVTFATIGDAVRALPGETATFEVLRPAIMLGLAQREERFTVQVPIDSVGHLGVSPQPRTVYHRVPPSRILPEALALTGETFSLTMQVVGKLVTGGVSPRELGGPVMIYQGTAQAAQVGWWWLVEWTALISINLCIFNLLPLPVLDGGQIALLGVEAVRRKPLDMRIMERVQQFGVIFIIFLILFVTYNDIARWISNIVP